MFERPPRRPSPHQGRKPPLPFGGSTMFVTGCAPVFEKAVGGSTTASISLLFPVRGVLFVMRWGECAANQ